MAMTPTEQLAGIVRLHRRRWYQHTRRYYCDHCIPTVGLNWPCPTMANLGHQEIPGQRRAGSWQPANWRRGY